LDQHIFRSFRAMTSSLVMAACLLMKKKTDGVAALPTSKLTSTTSGSDFVASILGEYGTKTKVPTG
jgi:hypothetical protein